MFILLLFQKGNLYDGKKYLNEERYLKTKKKIVKIAGIILLVGLLVGGSLIATGLIKQEKVNSKYSEESRASIQKQLETEKQILEAKKLELENKGIKYDAFADYGDGEIYDLHIITRVLDPSFDSCSFDEYKNNSLTSKYCSCKEQLEDFTEFNKSFDSYDNIPFYMLGAFVIIASSMISFAIYMVTKQREIAAFGSQQIMPVAQEGMETIAPSIGNVAKEISKGIKEGIKGDKE